MADTITLAIDALASAAFIEGGVSIERTNEAREYTEQRKRELIEAIAASHSQAVAEQAAPAAPDTNRLRAEILEHASKGSRLVRTLFNEPTGTLSDVEVGDWIQRAQQYLRFATPALPATGDSSAGDLAEEKIAYEMSREERMIVLQRDTDGTPTVWCDPEIADIVCALNSGGVKTVASCSGHGVKPGGIALADGRQLLLLESLEAFNSAMSAITQAEVRAEPVAEARVSQDAAGKKTVELELRYGDLPSGTHLLSTAPQAQPADALDAKHWRDHIGKLDALVTYCPTCCQGFTAKPEMTRDEVIFECGKTAGRSAAMTKEGK